MRDRLVAKLADAMRTHLAWAGLVPTHTLVRGHLRQGVGLGRGGPQKGVVASRADALQAAFLCSPAPLPAEGTRTAFPRPPGVGGGRGDVARLPALGTARPLPGW